MTWVFKIKVNDDRSLSKYKARFCVVGTGQQQGTDFFEKFACGARGTSVKMCCICTCVQGWIDFHFDLDGAYLDADIDTDVYVDQAQGVPHVVGPRGERMCMKLDKAIYGTVQAGRLFTKKFRAALIDIGFECCLDDESVYRLRHRLGDIILSAHVDDGIGGASTQAVLDWMYEQIIAHGFSFSQRGPWKTVLGFGAERNREQRTVKLMARKHIADLVNEHLADETVNLHPPTPSQKSVMDLKAGPVETPEQIAANAGWRTKARSLKGALIHIAQIHPAIANATSRCCALMAMPTHESYAAAKRILAWLRDRPTLGVVWGAPHLTALTDLIPKARPLHPMGPERDYSLNCTVDSDLPGTPMTNDPDAAQDRASHRAQLGYVLSLAGGCIEGVSRRQHSTAVDTPAAELFAASTAAAIIINVNAVLAFVSFGILGNDPVRMWCDNEAAVMVSKDATSIKRLAYIARRVRFLQELVERAIVTMLNVSGKVNPADALTKHVEPKTAYREYMARIYNVSYDSFAQPKESPTT